MELSHGPQGGELVEGERAVYEAMLPLDGARVLELGCGKAAHTRALAEAGRVEAVVAYEVDEIQQRANLQKPLPRTTFSFGGAEAIDEPDQSFDIALMFKSLHHVPVERMDDALREIHRVLRPGGLAYVSEPVFAGAYNEIMRLFHDEQFVREEAFQAVKRSVDKDLFALETERFIRVPIRFADFADFDERVLHVTHTRHDLSADLREQVRERFEAHLTPGGVNFEQPIRIDLLRRR